MTRLSIVEKTVLFLVVAMLAAGYILFYTDLHDFVLYVQEDGIVEWLTVLGLLSGAVVCFARAIKLRRYKTGWFLFVTIAMGLILFFVAGEEISWGQRIFGIQSSEFFKEKNSQGETNLHNLVVSGVKINKIIFSIGLVAVMAIYLIGAPLLYRYSGKLRYFINNSGIPVPRFYQVACILLVFTITTLLPHEKKAELLEGGIGLLSFLMIRFPRNTETFDKPVVLE